MKTDNSSFCLSHLKFNLGMCLSLISRNPLDRHVQCVECKGQRGHWLRNSPVMTTKLISFGDLNNSPHFLFTNLRISHSKLFRDETIGRRKHGFGASGQTSPWRSYTYKMRLRATPRELFWNYVTSVFHVVAMRKPLTHYTWL